MSSVDVGEIVIKTQLDGDGIVSGANKIDSKLNETGNSAGNLGKAASAGLATVTAAAAAATAAVGGLMAAATAVGSNFEASMSQVAATMGMSADEIAAGSESYTLLENAAKQAGATTKYSASEAAQALNYLALAGYDAQKSAETLPKVLNLAAAGGMDLAYASDLVTDSMAALGLETSQLDNYIDEMAKTSQKSNTSVSQLGEATLVVAGMVSMTGQSLETMNAELGVLANNGIKGAEGGTHLRNMLLSLSSPTDAASKAIEKLNIDVFDSQGNMRDLNDILVDMNAAMSGMTSAEKTNIINTIFNKTDIAAVNALLKGTGDEFNNLKGEIESAAGAAGTMADTMNDNLTGKITILKSSLEGLGIAAYDVFEQSMKDGVDSATAAVGKLTKEISGGKLGKSLNTLGGQLASVLDITVDFATSALPVLISGVSWIIDNIGVIVAGVVGLEVALNGYTFATEAAATAQTLFNAILEANPYVLMASALAAVISALVAYSAIVNVTANDQSEVVQSTNEMVRSHEGLRDSIEQSAAAFKDQKAEIEGQAAVARKLVNELDALQNKSKLTAEEQTRQKSIVDQLNSIYPDMGVAIDSATGKIKGSTDAIRDHIDAMQKQAKAAALQDRLTQIAGEQVDAEMAIYEAQQKRTEAQDELTAAQEAYNALIEKSKQEVEDYGRVQDNTALAISDASTAVDEARAAYDACNDDIAATKKELSELGNQYDYITGEMSDTGAIDATGEAIEELAENADDAADSLNNFSEAAQEVAKSVAESLESQTGIFDEWSGSVKMSADAIINNLDSQTKGLENWAENMKILAEKGVNQGLIQELIDAGPEAAGSMQSIVDMLEKEGSAGIDRLNEAYANKVSANSAVVVAAAQVADGLIETVTTGTDEAAAAAEEGGEAVMVGATEAMKAGVSAKKTEVAEAVKTTVTDSAAQAQTTAQDGTMAGVGQTVDTEIASGINSGETEVTAAIDQLGSAAIDKAQKKFSKTVFHAIGLQITDGITSGVLAGTSTLTAAMEAIINAAITAAQKAAKIHSPSKVARDAIGKNLTAGVAVGIDDGTAELNKTAAASINSAINYMQGAMAKNAESSGNAERVINNVSNNETITNAVERESVSEISVTLEGDAAGIFEAVRTENRKRTRITGRNALA